MTWEYVRHFPEENANGSSRNAILFLVGLEYNALDPKYKLQDTYNDIKTNSELLRFLEPKLNYKKVYVATDTEKMSKQILPDQKLMKIFKNQHTDMVYFKGTRNNITKHLKEALDEMDEENDFMWAVFAGHGTQTEDEVGGDETDGWDECFIASDGKYIVDDELRRYIDANKKKKFITIFDCCHSGTMLDLDTTKLYDNGYVVSLAACHDPNTAIETKHNGLLTQCFDYLARGFQNTYDTSILFMTYSQIECLINMKANEEKHATSQQAEILPNKMKCENKYLGRIIYKDKKYIKKQIKKTEANINSPTMNGGRRATRGPIAP